jgi:hypothetical protein
MAEKDNNKMIYLLLLVGGVGYLMYKKWKENQPEGTDDRVIDTWGVDDFTEANGRKFVDPSLYEKKDPEFMEHVKHLQQKLNSVIEKMGGQAQFPYYPLNVDGLLGWRTALATARVFGTETMPIKSLDQIKWYLSNFK